MSPAIEKPLAGPTALPATAVKSSRGMGARVRRRENERAPPRRERVTLRGLAAALALYAIATVVLSYPLAFHPKSFSRLDNGDARLNAWAVSWVAHQLAQDPLHLFDANIFHPVGGSLAFSEHLTLQGLLSLPLLEATDDLVLTTNLLLLFSMWATAAAMYFLAKTLTGNDLASLLAGLFFSFATFRFNRLPHLQMQLYAFLPLFLAFWHRYLGERKTKDLLLVGLFFTLQALSGTYLGAMAAVALAAALASLLPFSRLSGRDLVRVLAMLLLSAIALVPFASPYLRVHRELGIEWDLPGVASLAATPSSYFASSSHLYRGLSSGLFRDHPPTDYLFPGLSVSLLALTGAVVLARNSGQSRRVLLCYLLIFAFGFLISLGPRTPFHPFLYDHVVFFRGLRALARFGLLPLFSLSVLAAAGASWLFSERGLRRPRLAAAGIALFFIAESTALPYELSPWKDEPPEVYRWLGGREAKPGPIVELPFKIIDTHYMFWARHHGFRPMLNGDSGFVPVSHYWIKEALTRFPSPDSVALLRRLKVRYVLIHMGAFREGQLLPLLAGLDRHRADLVPAWDFGKDVVYEVVPERSSLARRPDEAFVPLIVQGSVPAALFDGDTRSPVSLPVSSGPSFTIPAGEKLAAIELHYGRVPRVPVERIEILNETGQTAWTTPSVWPALTELVSGLLANPRDGIQTVAVEGSIQLGQGKLELRFQGVGGEPAELTELRLLASPVAAEHGKGEHELEPQ